MRRYLLNALSVIVLVLEMATQMGASFAFSSEDVQKVALSAKDKIRAQFKSLDLYFTGGRLHHEKFSYRLFTPPEINKEMKYPLLVWFHGAGEGGSDNVKHLVHVDTAISVFESKQGPFPGFILAPQNPKRTPWFGGPNGRTEDDMLSITWRMVQSTIQAFPIDEDRIVVAGVSSGGNACWEMALRHPGQFAAIAPVAAAGGDKSRAGKLLGCPIWAFNNVYDKQAPIDGTRQMVAAVRAAGGRAKLTEVVNIGHAVWIEALHNDSNLLEWLLARRRGEWSWQCYYQFVEWQRIAVQCGLPATVLTISLIWLWRRRRFAVRPRSESFKGVRYGSEVPKSPS